MAGQLDNKYGERGDSKPLTNQSAPTTATPGYLGEVRFDTNGNEWKLIKIDGSTYYWSPVDCFPADNTEYPAYIENGVVVWKKAITSIATAGQTTALALGVTIDKGINIQAVTSVNGFDYINLYGTTLGVTTRYSSSRTNVEYLAGAHSAMTGASVKLFCYYTKL